MSIRTPRSRITVPDDVFARAKDIAAGVQHLLPVPGQSPNPAKYPSIAIIVTAIVCAIQGLPYAASSWLGVIWFDYSPAQLAELGLTDHVTPERRKANTRQKKWKREHDNVLAALDRFMDLMDPSPFDRRQLRMRNHEIKRQLKAVTPERRAELDRKRQLLITFCNLLLAGSINDKCPPGYRGDLTLDGHMVSVARMGDGVGTGDDMTPGPDPEATPWLKDRTRGFAFVHQIVFGIRTYPVYGKVLPRLAVSISIDRAAGGSLLGARDVLVHAQQNGFSVPKSNYRPLIVSDMGFSPLIGYADIVYDLGYNKVVEFPRKAEDRKETWGGTTHALNTGAILEQGCILCPAALAITARNLDPLPRDGHSGLEDDEFIRNLAAQEAVASTRMRINSVKLSKNGGLPGQPRKDLAARPTERVYMIQTQCPADALGARCTRRAASFTDPRVADKPLLMPPPDPAGPDGPEACRTNSTAHLSEAMFRQFQQEYPGTYEHHDIYSNLRAYNEGYHSPLTSAFGAGLRYDRKAMVGSARILLISTLAAIATNLNMQGEFRDEEPPAPYDNPRVADRNTRRARIDQLRNRHQLRRRPPRAA